VYGGGGLELSCQTKRVVAEALNAEVNGNSARASFNIQPRTLNLEAPI
jgi:hypothetical protein